MNLITPPSIIAERIEPSLTRRPRSTGGIRVPTKRSALESGSDTPQTGRFGGGVGGLGRPVDGSFGSDIHGAVFIDGRTEILNGSADWTNQPTNLVRCV